MICIYCGCNIKGKKSQEHVIPQWIIKRIGIQKYKHKFVLVSHKLNRVGERTPVTNTITHTVCSECNNGWLSDIDKSCTKALTELIDSANIYQENLNDELNKICTLIYKIFLNFFATGPESFKKDKLHIFNEFYKHKCPPYNVELYLSKIRSDAPIRINHADIWIHNNDNYIYKDPLGIRFKFFLQLGKIAFVLCSSGDRAKTIVYDSKYLHPLVKNPPLLTTELGLDNTPPPEFEDNLENRILFNSLQIFEH
ncbi:hypothetical protein Q5M44_01170 [Acinetobacter pittii]|uniref:hypothetical protein n=1 Tax=Acinetobacter pittii TaxID=48296 RepID=UPI00105DA815|nr:hypothetical protein [Acinetobacter pittii]MDO7243144.1 hypothetical protein [Acinetobacter pittii]TDM62419.1 hypothetical protein C5B72_13540 [Acinetobacter sp. KU 011TH]TDM62648.1 hypothetical protein C4608_13550 [Acinetobacter sp. KU 013TH]